MKVSLDEHLAKMMRTFRLTRQQQTKGKRQDKDSDDGNQNDETTLGEYRFALSM